MFDWENAIALHAMQGNRASSQFDFGYTEQFCIPGVTSVVKNVKTLVVYDVE